MKAARYQKQAGHVHAAEFCCEYFGRTFDWFKRNRKLLEEGFAFPAPIPPGTYLVYYADEIAAWRWARRERARQAVLERRVGGAALSVEVREPPFAGGPPNWDALKEKPDG